jgi:hypothetical protein
MRDPRLTPVSVCVLIASSLVAACAGHATPTRSGEVTPAAAPRNGVIPTNARSLPNQLLLDTRLNRTLSTDMPEGYAFSTTVTQKITASDGSVAVPAGTVIRGVVTGVRPAKGQTPPVIAINLDFLELRARSYGVRTTIENIALNDSVLTTTGTAKANTAVARLLPHDSLAAIFPTKPGELPTPGIAIQLAAADSTEPAELPAGSLFVVRLDSALTLVAGPVAR